jgi:alkylation response protein AidB-like acyl-CoA dehydrogenase
VKSMVDFSLTDEQRVLQGVVRDFVNKEVKPDCRRRERIEDPDSRVPWDWIAMLSRMGIRTMPVPTEYGGAGADAISLCVVAEELSAGDAGLAETICTVWRWIPALIGATSAEQREKYLPRFMEDDTFLLAYGITEPHAGSDHMLPYNVPGHGGRTAASRDPDGCWVLNGRKIFVSNGGLAKLYIIQARTEPNSGGVEGLSAFLLEPTTPGFSIGRIEDKMGQRLMQNAELVFDDCRLPPENLLGQQGRGRTGALVTTGQRKGPRTGSAYSAVILGPGRAAFDDALAYAKWRVQGGRPIIQHQAVKMMLADMAIQMKAARALVWQTAWASENPGSQDPSLFPITKVFVSEASFNVCRLAVEVFGGSGIMRDSPVEKYLRDATCFLHATTNQMNRLHIGDALEGVARLPGVA